MSAPVDWEPLTALAPDQAPEAAQLVALVDDHVRDVALPLVIELGLALKLTVGAAALTDTVADCSALPPAPVQVNVYVVLAVSAPVDCEPLMARLPDQPPDATQEVALADDQESVEPLPLAMVLGLALNLTVGAADFTETLADCAALPPAPVHVRVYVAFAVSAPVDCEPLSALPPDQAPEALHAVA